MKILRQTPLELVTVESTLWISLICGLASLTLLYTSITTGNPKPLIVAGFFGLFALPWLRKMTFVFDAMQRMVRWNGRKPFKVESGTSPFDEITDVGIETITGGESGGVTYRLTILTPQGAVPMAYSYEGYSPRCESLRKTILAFIKPDQHNAADLEAAPSAGNAVDDESSIRSLLKQGRKIDAIILVRTRENLGLTQAVQRVNEVGKKMKVES